MISIYEAVAQITAPQTKPVPGAVVPQVQSQQQPQSQSVQNTTKPLQQEQQPTAATTSQKLPVSQQSNPPQSNPQQPEQLSNQPVQPEEPKWKKNLKIAAMIGAGIGGGAFLHDVYHNGGLSNWFHKRFDDIHFSPGAMMGGLFGNEADNVEDDDSGAEEISKPKRVIQGHATRASRDILSSPREAPMVGPRSSPTADPWTYNHHRPQPGGLVKRMMPGMRQGYVGRGGNTGLWGIFGSGSGGGSLSFSGRGRAFSNYDDSSRGAYIGSSHGILDPINNYDLGLRHGDMNGA